MPQKSLGRVIRVIALLVMGLAGAAPGFAQSNPAPQKQEAATGRTVWSVDLGKGGKRTGVIRKVDLSGWIESDAAGNEVFAYTEIRRGDETVYLEDTTRGMEVKLDLAARKATFTNSTSRRREFFDISTATPGTPEQLTATPERQERRLSPRERMAEGSVFAEQAPPPPAYCINDLITRPAGTIPGRTADCPAGFALSGGSCKRPGETVAAPSRAADCPAGYTNTGSACERPAATKPNPNSRAADCPDGYTNSGTACFRLSAAEPLGVNVMTCKGGETKLDARCFKACETGFTAAGASCTRVLSTLGADKMSCKAGFQKNKENRCIAECAAGFTNTGEACARAASTASVDAMTCKAGETRKGDRCLPSSGGSCAKGEVLQGGLCYAACAPGYEGVGNACVAAAPKAWLQCGMGSGKDAKACAAAVFDPLVQLKQAAIAVGVPAAAGAPAARAAAMQKKFKDLNDAYARTKDLPAFKAAKDAWDQANAGKDAHTAAPALDNIARVTSEDEMMRFAGHLVAVTSTSGNAGTTYPKCSVLFPGK